MSLAEITSSGRYLPFPWPFDRGAEVSRQDLSNLRDRARMVTGCSVTLIGQPAFLSRTIPKQARSGAPDSKRRNVQTTSTSSDPADSQTRQLEWRNAGTPQQNKCLTSSFALKNLR
ncbi:hypothetical protein EMPG_12818 [Blastomyces silverae]|uniref:Uncharacterized protein n=1 Tax=Blastomyces silverae TaxID=2060906 RepID=A0A0H1BSE8_9EURO|nr:hypothetical protein EMPG_12818 [Blastomyces silverae]